MRHVDVDKAVEEMKRAHDAYSLPTDAPKHIFVQHRNFAVEREIMRMVMSEENRSTDPEDIVYAFAGMIANFVGNMIADDDEESAEIVVGMLLNAVLGNLQSERTCAARIEVDGEVGGHA